MVGLVGMPIRRKLIALLLLASLAPMTVAIVFMSVRAQSFARGQAVSVLGTRGDQLAAELDGFNEGYRAAASRTASIPLVRNFLTSGSTAEQARYDKDLHDTLDVFVRSDQRVRGVGILDLDGRQLFATSYFPIDPDVRLRNYFREAAGGAFVASDLFVAMMAPEPAPVIAYAAPVRAADGKIVAVVALYVRAAAFWDALRAGNGRAGSGSFSVLYDRYGIRIAHSFSDSEVFRPGGTLKADVIAAFVAEKRFGERTRELLESPVEMPGEFDRARQVALDHETVFKGYSPANGQMNLVVARRLRTVSWTVFCLAPVASIEAPVQALTARSAIAGAGLVVIALLLGLGVIASVIRPLRSLVTAADALRQGDLDTRAPIAAEDEVGKLGRAFNAMAEVLQSDRDHLEQKVRERTIDLERASDELQAQKEELIAQREELKAQQREVRQKNQEISRADQLKSEFLANMSHELRTPLNSIIGFSELMLDPETSDRSDDAIHLGHILASGRNLLALINDILDLSKIEAGHASLKRVAIAPADLLTEACTLIGPAASKKNLVIKREVLAQRPVDGDPAKLRQILLNLLSNAVKFAPDGSTILAVAENTGPFVRFRVSDQGPGIEPALLGRLFEPFVQGENPLHKKHQGTGLGLAISKRLVEQHGGTIGVDSAPGGGATFAFTIPAADAGTPGGASIADRPLVMIVDDNRRSAGQVRARLESGGYRVIEFDNGRDVAAVAAEVRPAAIVLDPGTDRRDGIRMLDALARREETREIPVVMSRMYRANLVPKPVEARQLLHQLQRLIAPGSSATRRPMICAIDDDPRVLALLDATLTPAGYEVRTFHDPRAGLASLQTDPPDLLIVDLVMPGLSGFEIIDAFTAGERTRGRPIVVLTAADLSAAERDRLRKDVRWLAAKGSVTEDDLLAAVSEATRDRAPQTSVEVQESPEVTPAVELPDASRRAETTILVVDDSDVNRTLACSILERKGYRTVAAVDGNSGIEAARKERPALIVMDLAMPGKDGYTAAREIRADPELAQIPIVALTALAMSGDEQRAFDAGIDGYVTKPVERRKLEEIVAKFLAN